MNSALVFTAYQRSNYWRQTLESWNRVRGINDWPVTIFLEPSPIQDDMIAITESILPNCEVRVNPTRLGVLNNPYNALGHGFSTADFVVLAEEDIIVSADVLEYFEWASNIAKDDKNVLGVCAFSERVSSSIGSSAVHLVEYFGSWVWGTWKDRWFDTIEPTWDHDYGTGSGEQKGWDWNLSLRLSTKGRGFLFPEASRSKHIGQVGQHMSFVRGLAAPTKFVENRAACRYKLVQP